MGIAFRQSLNLATSSPGPYSPRRPKRVKMDSFHLGLEMITPSTPRPVSMHKEGAKTPIPTRRHSPIGALKQESAPSPAQDSVIEPSGQAVLNPDLPTRDVLFVFSNMYSYTRTPKQGAQGVTDEDLRHASRLLDYSRVCFSDLLYHDHFTESPSRIDVAAKEEESSEQRSHQVPFSRSPRRISWQGHSTPLLGLD